MPVRRSRLVLAVLAPLVTVAVVLGIGRYRGLERTVAAKFEGRPWSVPSRVYTDAFALIPGIDVNGTGFFERLRRLGYREVDEVRGRGEVRRDPRGAVVDVYLHAFQYPLHPEEGRAIRLALDHAVITRITDV